MEINNGYKSALINQDGDDWVVTLYTGPTPQFITRVPTRSEAFRLAYIITDDDPINLCHCTIHGVS